MSDPIHFPSKDIESRNSPPYCQKCSGIFVTLYAIGHEYIGQFDSLFPKQALVFTCLQCKSFKNTVGKEEIARNEQFLLFL